MTAFLPYSLPPCIPHKIRFKCRLKWMRIFLVGIFFFFFCFLAIPSQVVSAPAKVIKIESSQSLVARPTELNRRPYQRPDQDQDQDQDPTVPYRTEPMIISAISAWVQLLQRLCCWRMMSLTHSTHTHTHLHSHTHTHLHTRLIGWAQATRLGCQ